MHDARILQNSLAEQRTLYQRAEQGDILNGPVVDVDGHEIGPYLLGDSAYLISPWLQKPFPEATRDRSEIQFNRELSSARVKVECAFGCLKSQWRILQKRLDSNLAFSVKTTIACAVLHNFCIKMGDDWDDDGNPDHHDCNNDNADVVRDGDEIRDMLKEFLWILIALILMLKKRFYDFRIALLQCYTITCSLLYVLYSLFTVLTNKLSHGTNKLLHHCHLLLLCLRKICHKSIKIIPAFLKVTHTFPKLPSFLFFLSFQVCTASFPCGFFPLASHLLLLLLPCIFLQCSRLIT